MRSILGRYLEHSRVYAFRNGGDDLVLMGSADVMHRNLDRRVEALVQIRDAAVRADLLELLRVAKSEETAAWILQADGCWQRHQRDADGEPLRDSQETLLARTAERAAEARAETVV